ncbi:Peptidase S8, subtilisin-related protein [Cordyceps fumosorosea ARSEF 2679]|uniref:Peptidase S8, subtilisin-related protein n=1 Tax=Cordyceps fumosorosea (strain ARSEF 2679) TaxID=1081104 RepID=A0A167LLI1_CORFA|nr:Peptidase S8, subtilisin-related protein [Cordyceps fumosorosea ARSEF 2679]OAA53223.1 Peptidase S8, subtilisin-related protein [Cordyceps fumosorosea ARSEF 2679]
MVRTSSLLSLLATAATTVVGQADPKPATPPAIPGAYIIEFEDGHNTQAAIDTVKQDATVRLNLNYDLFQGVSIQLNDVKTAEEKAKKLADLPEVKNIWPVTVVPRPDPIIEWVATEGLQVLGDKSASVGGLGARDTADPISTAQRMGQIEKMRAKGYKGRGIKIAVVDSGIDYKHPALGGCFGEGCLVTHGYDLVGNDYGSTSWNPAPKDDPMDCGGHGSHVAGIIAAQPNQYNFTGVAPDVTLGAFKVFGCKGGTGTDILISAFNRAYQAGSDLITASIGGPAGWVDEPWALAVSRIVERGVPCTISAGNSGTYGLLYPSSGSSAKGAVSIASYDNTDTPALANINYYSVDGGDKQEILTTGSDLDAWDGVTLDVWAGSYDTNKTDDGCSALPADTPDLSNKIVLIHRGTCSFVDKVNNAAAKGAKYIMIYNNKPDPLSMLVDGAKALAVGLMGQDDGIKLINLLKAGKEVTLSMNSNAKTAKVLSYKQNTITGGALSSYTSWGPSWELYVKPDVGAPGGNILSTYPTAKGSWAVMSGTSMAAPFIAGSVALILEVRGKKLSPATITNLLSANAKPQLFSDNTKFLSKLAPVPQQGAGIIQVYDSAFATTLLEPSSLSFNDTANFVKKHTIKLSNTGEESVSYDLGQVSAFTMYSLGTSGTQVTAFPNDAVDAYAKLSFSKDKVTIAAGGSESVDVTVSPPEGVDVKRLPIWSGYITFNGTDGTSLSMPYQGVSGSMLDHAVIDRDGASWIAWSDDKDLKPLPVNMTFTLPKPGQTGWSTRLPTFVLNMSLGSKNVTGHLEPMTTCPPNGTYEYKGFKTIGSPADFPLLYISRLNRSNAWDGQLASGQYAPAGKYRLITRALRVFGDPSNEKDWDTSIGNRFVIKYE